MAKSLVKQETTRLDRSTTMATSDELTNNKSETSLMGVNGHADIHLHDLVLVFAHAHRNFHVHVELG